MNKASLMHTFHCKNNSFKNLCNIIFRKGLAICNAFKEFPSLQQLHDDHGKRQLDSFTRDTSSLGVHKHTLHLHHTVNAVQIHHQIYLCIDFFQLGATCGISKELEFTPWQYQYHDNICQDITTTQDIISRWSTLTLRANSFSVSMWRPTKTFPCPPSWMKSSTVKSVLLKSFAPRYSVATAGLAVASGGGCSVCFTAGFAFGLEWSQPISNRLEELLDRENECVCLSLIKWFAPCLWQSNNATTPHAKAQRQNTQSSVILKQQRDNNH